MCSVCPRAGAVPTAVELQEPRCAAAKHKPHHVRKQSLQQPKQHWEDIRDEHVERNTALSVKTSDSNFSGHGYGKVYPGLGRK